jgi:3-methyladenine DNA glycosylase/8-oxoguanine DNA glycosylase
MPGVEDVSGDAYRRTFALDAARGTIEVRRCPGSADCLQVEIHGAGRACAAAVAARVRHFFDLDADPVAIGTHLAADPQLAPLIAARPGLRVPGAWDGFELAARAVLGQQVSVRAATTFAGRLVAALGTALDGKGAAFGLSHLFPRAQVVADCAEGVLARQLRIPRARAATLRALAAAAAAGDGLLGQYRSLTEAVAALRQLPGIGDWTAQYIAMRALREADAFPSGDIGLRRALADPRSGRRPADRELRARAERWRPWRGYATLHLWTAPAGAPALAPAAAPRRRSP